MGMPQTSVGGLRIPFHLGHFHKKFQLENFSNFPHPKLNES